MADVSYDARDKIDAILEESGRLRFLLSDTYGVTGDQITKIRVDGDNVKVDVWIGERMLRFKAKGTDRALRLNPDSGVMEMVFDPALAQGLYNLVDEFARG